MSVKKVPRAAFFLEVSPAQRAREDLTHKLQLHLARRFGNVEFRIPFVQRVLFKRSMLLVHVDGKGIVVALARHGIPREVPEHRREWDLAIDPFDPFVPMERMLKMEGEYATELLLVSEHIHSLLIMLPGIRSLRWFFKGWDANIPGVRGPAELPWNLKVPSATET